MIVTKYLSTHGRNYQVSPHFKLYEFASPNSNRVLYSTYIVEWLEKIRAHFGGSITITSGYRTPTYNASVGGASNSAHIYGQAVDFRVYDGNGALVDSKLVCLWLEEVGYKYGIGYIKTATHMDSRYTNRIIEFPKPYIFLNRIGTTFAKYWHIPVTYSGVLPTAPVSKMVGTKANIILWQKFLNWYGIKTTVDGSFGTQSYENTKIFQRANMLLADGKAGYATLKVASLVKK